MAVGQDFLEASAPLRLRRSARRLTWHRQEIDTAPPSRTCQKGGVSMADDVASRVKRFRTEIDEERKQSLKDGRWNYRAAYGLTIVAVGCSAAAGILGLGWKIDQRIV